MNGLQGIVKNLPETEYHARPELSSTEARALLPRFGGSPKNYLWEKENRRNSRAFDVGHAVHAKVLGVGAEVVEYPAEHLTPSGNVSTKAATVAWEAEQREAGLTPVSPAEAWKVNQAAESVLAHESARPLLEVAVNREASVFAEVDGVPCRARFDALSDETRRGVLAVDVKSTPDVTEAAFTRSVQKFGYDVQEAWYRDVYAAAELRPVDEFWFIAVQTKGPFDVAVHRIEDFWLSMARKETAEARRIFRECTESGRWPGYDPKPHTLTAPAWAVIEHELAYEGEEIQV